MTITNDERRHAVEFLRTANCSDVACADCKKVSAALFGKGCENALCNLDDCSDCGDSKPWRRLADLIEPEPERTCHIKISDCTDSLGQKMYRCSECGSLTTNDACFFEGEPDIDWFSYCPNCGAKVVEE